MRTFDEAQAHLSRSLCKKKKLATFLSGAHKKKHGTLLPRAQNLSLYRQQAGISGKTVAGLNTRSLTLEVPQIVQTASAHTTFCDHFHMIDERGIQRENALNAHAVRNFAHRKAGIGGTA